MIWCPFLSFFLVGISRKGTFHQAKFTSQNWMSIVMVVPQARWMVYFMENPIVKWMMTRGVPLVISWFLNHSNYRYITIINRTYWSYLNQLRDSELGTTNRRATPLGKPPHGSQKRWKVPQVPDFDPYPYHPIPISIMSGYHWLVFFCTDILGVMMEWYMIKRG